MIEPVDSTDGRRVPSLGRRGFLKSAAAATVGPAVAAGPAQARAEQGRGAVARLLAVPRDRRDEDWIRRALQIAVELELATIPPYLCAWWSIEDRDCEPAALIKGIVCDEMFHMGSACNLLVAVGGTPRIADAVPGYPGPLPGGVRGGLTVYLSGLTKEYVREVLMGIETPESPLARQSGPPTIGAFYTALLTAFQDVRPALAPDRQLELRIGPDTLTPVTSLDDVEQSIETIREQGEGTSATPEAPSAQDAPAHYYAFGEIYHERRLQQVGGAWEFSGEAVPFPQTRPMGVVPAGGWPSPAAEVQDLLQQFDDTFSDVLQGLQDAWANGDSDALDGAVGAMLALEKPALALMDIPLPDGSGRYGPQFRPRAATSD
ncbi:ferritin-like protein [Kitasatospora sp. NBC_01250]|uniref:ferritin-like domain-containing protein n=1 Tax=Kitasatospora sp. NBC_01250 TaxID=2903571 RepID=UPI002E2FD364|nr:ferritin-like protein [Kitasatospora sp. NBC_01250]